MKPDSLPVADGCIRLALFTDSLEPSGVGRVMQTVVRHLPRDRYAIFLVCADHPGADGLAAGMRERVAEVARFTVRGDDDLAALHALVDQLRSWRVDIFHNHIGATWEGEWGTLAARCAGVPLVVATDHLPCVLSLAHEKEHRRRMGHLLDRIFAVSESVRRSLLSARLAPARRVVTVANGVEPPAWSFDRTRARRELAIADDVSVILFLGRLVEQKEPALLLRALSLLPRMGRRVLTLVAGDGPLRAELEREAGERGLSAQVRFLGSRGDAGRLLAAADVLAMPSRFEGLPLAALEAMAMGRPVVGCDAPGVRDAVLHGVTGWLAPIGDAGELACGLQLALSPSPGAQWAQASRRRYEKEFTAEQMAARHDRQYTRALAALRVRSAGGETPRLAAAGAAIALVPARQVK